MAKTIPVSVPCHCALLTQAATLFAQSLHECVFKIPNIAVVSNVDCSVYTSAEHIRGLLALQLHQPVRWVESIQSMQRQGVELFIECGPGKVLSGLIKRIDKSVKTASVLDILKV